MDQLLAGRDPRAVFAKDGLVDELKKTLANRVLSAELDDHLDGEAAAGKAEDDRQRLRPRNELLNGEIFYTLAEARIVIENWRRHFTTLRLHGPLGYKPPAPGVFVSAMTARPLRYPDRLRRPRWRRG